MKALLIAIAMFTAVGFATRPAEYHVAPVYALPGAETEPFLALTEGMPQAAVHLGLTNDGRCSVVAISFERALTAAHCSEVNRVLTKDGIMHNARAIKISSNSDIAILAVDDLYCPCAPYSMEAPNKGEELLLVGFAWGKYHSEHPVVKMYEISNLREALRGWQGIDDDEAIDKAIAEGKLAKGFIDGAAIIATEGMRPGMSGGGTFVKREGEWVLVGINSFWIVDGFAGPMVSGSALIGASDLFKLE